MRRFILFVALTLLLLDLQEVVSDDCCMTTPCKDIGAGTEFYQKPDQLYSTESSWSVRLVVDIGTLKYKWLQLKRRLYNGKGVGPTIKIKRGDKLNLHLINNLSPVGNDRKAANKMQKPNSTNIHTHGLHISSECGQDNVLIEVGPEDSFIYEYKIQNHTEPGTYWYHAHWHGSTAIQVTGGLAGLIIAEDKVEDMTPELAAASCPDNCDRDIQLLFQSSLLFGHFGSYEKLQTETGDYEGFKNDQYKVRDYNNLTYWLAQHVQNYTTNGQLQPRLPMEAGQMYRFRMANAGNVYTLQLHITDDKGKPTQHCTVREIAIDAVYLPCPMSQIGGLTEVVPGGRVDWLVRCDQIGHYKVQALSDAGLQNLLHLDVLLPYVPKLPQQFPETLPKHIFLEDLSKAPESDIKGRFVVYVGPNRQLNHNYFGGGTNIRYTMKLGEIQEWQLVSLDKEISHPIHMHVNHFQIISYNTSSEDKDQSKPSIKDLPDQPMCSGTTAIGAGQSSGSRLGIFRDTIYVRSQWNVTVRFRPTDLTGIVVIHCHILPHEDTGMMMVVKIE